MSDTEEVENKLSLVVRKPQEGKTSICIASITNDRSKNIHIVLTMNTLSSGMQFFGRMQNEIEADKIVVFNSDKKSAGACHHAKTVTEVLGFIKKQDIKVIVCCAHVLRMRKSLLELFDFAIDSNTMMRSNIKFIVHIDEAHKYIPENMGQIREFNKSPIVSEIIGYSATPDGIWSSDRNDPIFHKILIRDLKKEFSIMHTEHYFGVQRCDHYFYDNLNHSELMKEIPDEIPYHVLRRSSMVERPRQWFGDNWHFDLGNEMLMMGFLNYILPTLKINPNLFSYYFAPAYTRKASQYQNVDIILKHYPTANVIVMNGNGYVLFRSEDGKSEPISSDDHMKQRASVLPEIERKKELDALLEPSNMIMRLIKPYPNCPTFITGHVCVGMSVTLINPTIGNFDGVIMSHQHYSRDKLYQLCRFMFNYEKWTTESRSQIKKTQFHSLTKMVIDTCIEYEKHIEQITLDFAGMTCSLREIQGLAEELTEREIMKQAFDKIKLKNDKLWKKFKVYEGNDDAMWDATKQFYKSITERDLAGKSMPQKGELQKGVFIPQKEGKYYGCSDSKGLGIQLASTFNSLENEKWSNRFQLRKNGMAYAHVFVGYEKKDDPTEYTIFIKYAVLIDTPETRDGLVRLDRLASARNLD
jgi:hypothetical protein